MVLTVHLLAVFVFVSLCVSSCVCSSVSSCMCSSVSCVSSSLESGRGMDKLFKVLIWGLPYNCFSRVLL